MIKSNNYIDAFVFPISIEHLNEYKNVAEKVADIWKEYGAISYHEFISDDLELEGVLSFTESIQSNDDEAIIFGWVVFPSRGVRDEANKKVPKDSRMTNLIGPLTDPERMKFDGSRMVYGGFKSFIQSV